MSFRDRADAGRRLVSPLAKYKGEDVVVFALPRGGVPVAAPIAGALGAPIHLLLVRKLGVPFQPELAMGAVADAGTPVIVRNDDVIAMAGVSEAEFAAVCKMELAEIDRRRRLYLGGRTHPAMRGGVAIVVDDGVATGATTRAALRAVRAREPKKLVLAVPVRRQRRSKLCAGRLTRRYVWKSIEILGQSDFFYEDFHQIADEEVIAILDRFDEKGRAQ